jgi:FkbM family methyltransferase
MDAGMSKKWMNFVIFHKELFDENYTCDPSFDLKKYKFVKGNEKFEPVYNKDFGYDVMYEHEFDYYDKRLQQQPYMAPGVIYHIYKNGLYKEYDYIGFLEYDLALRPMDKEGPINVTETVDRIVNENGTVHIAYRSVHSFRDLYGQNLILNGQNCLDTIVDDYNNYFGTEYDIDWLKNSSEKANTQQSFLVDKRTFEHIMGFIAHVIENRLAERCDNRLHPSTFLDRYFAVALKFEDIETIPLNLFHGAVGYKCNYRYGRSHQYQEGSMRGKSMVFFHKVKNLLGPLSRAFPPQERVSECEQQQRKIESGYETFCQLSEKKDLENIVFANGKAIITLKDRRRYHFDANDRVGRMYSVPHTGTFEDKETDFVRGFVQTGQVCIDAGASFGWYTILLSVLVGPTGYVHAFEPIPHTFDVLQSNVTLNGCSNVTLNNVALDATNGRKDLFLPDIGVSGSFRLHRYEKTNQTISCRTITLDDYCLEDIEGAEWLMLRGATETLRQSKPVLFLEIQSSSTKLFGYQPAELFTWLVELGYVPHYVTDTGSLDRVENYCEPLPDHNFIFLPTEGT